MRIGNIIKSHLAVDILDDLHLEHTLLSHSAHTKILGAFHIILLAVFLDQFHELLTELLRLTCSHTLDVLQFLEGNRINGGHLLQ